MSAPKRVKRHQAEALPLGTFLEEVSSAEELDALVLPLAASHATPSTRLRERLLASIAREHRFASFEDRFAELADLPTPVASVLLGRVDEKEHWSAAAIPGVELFHFDGGPRVRDAITGFVRMNVGCTFPMHEHAGREFVLILQGALRDDDGEEYLPGDEIEMDPHSSHSFSAVGTTPLLFITIVMKGIIINGQFIPPGDPRA